MLLKLKNNISQDTFLEYHNHLFKKPLTNNDSKLFQNETKEILTTIKGKHMNKSTGYEAMITSETIGKIIRPHPRVNWLSEKYMLNLFVARYLDILFKNSIYVDTLEPMKHKKENKNELGYHHFVAPIAVNGCHYRIIITAREKKNSDILYVVSVESVLLYSNVFNNIFNDNYSISYRISVRDLMYNVKIWNYDLGCYSIYTIDDFICSPDFSDFYCITSEVFILH